jgi:hypothetical protein
MKKVSLYEFFLASLEGSNLFFINEIEHEIAFPINRDNDKIGILQKPLNEQKTGGIHGTK